MNNFFPDTPKYESTITDEEIKELEHLASDRQKKNIEKFNKEKEEG